MKQNKQKFSDIIAKAWTDESFKQRLLMHHKKTCEEYGVQVSSRELKILENTQNTTYFVLPEKPKGNLSENELKQIAAAQSIPYNL